MTIREVAEAASGKVRASGQQIGFDWATLIELLVTVIPLLLEMCKTSPAKLRRRAAKRSWWDVEVTTARVRRLARQKVTALTVAEARTIALGLMEATAEATIEDVEAVYQECGGAGDVDGDDE